MLSWAALSIINVVAGLAFAVWGIYEGNVWMIIAGTLCVITGLI